MTDRLDIVIVGGGPAGLAISRELTDAGLAHVVLERGRVGQTWRERWDGFCLVTPNWSVQLPGHPYDGARSRRLHVSRRGGRVPRAVRVRAPGSGARERRSAADGRHARFARDLGASVAWGDQRHAQIMQLIRKVAAERGLPRPELGAFANDAAAQDAAAAGEGVMLAIAHTVIEPVRHGSLVRLDVRGTPADGMWHAATLGADRRSRVADALRRFVTTPDATHAIVARPGGVPAGRFRPPVYVTIWSALET
jgi:glycine/D-amino acid oxidase-like deaminating enzyme